MLYQPYTKDASKQLFYSSVTEEIILLQVNFNAKNLFTDVASHTYNKYFTALVCLYAYKNNHETTPTFKNRV